jgi:hypothetical protein
MLPYLLHEACVNVMQKEKASEVSFHNFICGLANVAYILPPARPVVRRFISDVLELDRLFSKDYNGAVQAANAVMLLVLADCFDSRVLTPGLVLPLLSHNVPHVRWVAMRVLSLLLNFTAEDTEELMSRYLTEAEITCCEGAWEDRSLGLQVRLFLLSSHLAFTMPTRNPCWLNERGY